jgi:SIR2-like protein
VSVVSWQQWPVLLPELAEGNCTPFLGAGASTPTLPLGSEIAKAWAEEHGYPLRDSTDLARVAQFVAISTRMPMHPKHDLRRRLAHLGPPDFSAPDEPHALLAELPISVYITTNYDDFMVQALRARGKEPVQDVCRWNSEVRQAVEVLDPEFEPSVERPVVFHLHGHFGLPASLVLTEDDYLGFLVEVSRNNQQLLPHQIRHALSRASLLFIGYRLADWTFRVLHGLLIGTERSLGRLNITVQVPPKREGDDDPRDPERELAYLDRYFDEMDVQVYWGSASQFMRDLRGQWAQYNSHG